MKDSLLVVGAYDNDDNETNAGAAYIFERSGSTWTETAKLVASVPTFNGNFGFSVATNGISVMVGARRQDAVYVFDDVGGSWTETSKIQPCDSNNSSHFYGSDIDIDMNYMTVSALGDDNNGGNSGSVYVYKYNSGRWEHFTEIDTCEDGVSFGRTIQNTTIQGGTIIVGAHRYNTTREGALYLFNQ